MKGLIALDVDGTLTNELLSMPARVARYLESLAADGWQLVFITGRTFQFAHEVLKIISAPYYVAVQNGAITIEMPSRKILSRKYLEASLLPELNRICHAKHTDYVIYSGFEYDDLVFYRTSYFTKSQLEYMYARTMAFRELWREVSSYDNIGITAFPSIKCFGDYDLAKSLGDEMEQRLGLHAPLIKDPFQAKRFVAQATHPEVTKGQALRDLCKVLSEVDLVIAAGDDHNDLSLFDAAHIKIAMADAPEELLDKADIVAPPALEEGIIAGLEMALKEI